MESTLELFHQEPSGPMLSPQLDLELRDLKQRYAFEVVEEPTVISLVIRSFPTSDHYSKPSTSLLIRIPRSYPDSGLDMFWTDPELLLKDGGIPNGAQVLELYPALDSIGEFKGKQWRRFSWHPQPTGPARWNPNVDNLDSYLEFVRKRFVQR